MSQEELEQLWLLVVQWQETTQTTPNVEYAGEVVPLKEAIETALMSTTG